LWTSSALSAPQSNCFRVVGQPAKHFHARPTGRGRRVVPKGHATRLPVRRLTGIDRTARRCAGRSTLRCISDASHTRVLVVSRIRPRVTRSHEHVGRTSVACTRRDSFVAMGLFLLPRGEP
jgi:hypothetical protein